MNKINKQQQAVTQYVFALDVDFVPSAGLHKFAVDTMPTFSEENQALVFPAFEVNKNLKTELGPLTVHSEIVRSFLEGNVCGFHVDYFPKVSFRENDMVDVDKSNFLLLFFFEIFKFSKHSNRAMVQVITLVG